ncbi:hypothetical protein SCLARK_001825 [Spiroplasma clarkii]|uniref:Lipoprotein n=1 Tax=Spiroplasma clarkii TaxID=2139 RepID=A0A1Y0L3H7_9MOLU|nr:hypothetical protein [Spiroplasma clarkii]ARU92268.1 hypothetical protein SCLARK_001825 [Spiroplasma clarkii]ATX71581.1 hypothetical protein SCLAR_v1c12830 [Spiroplasma clarkii]
MNRFKKSSWLFLVIIIMCSLVIGCGPKRDTEASSPAERPLMELPDKIVEKIRDETKANISNSFYKLFGDDEKPQITYSATFKENFLPNIESIIHDSFLEARMSIFEENDIVHYKTVKVTMKQVDKKVINKCVTIYDQECSLLNTNLKNSQVVKIADYDMRSYVYEVSTEKSKVYKLTINLKIPILNFRSYYWLTLDDYIEDHNFWNETKIFGSQYELYSYQLGGYYEFLKTEIGLGELKNDYKIFTKIEDYIAKKIIKMRSESIGTAFNHLFMQFDSLLEDEYGRYDSKIFQDKEVENKEGFCKIINPEAKISENHFCGQIEHIKNKFFLDENVSKIVFTISSKIDEGWLHWPLKKDFELYFGSFYNHKDYLTIEYMSVEM